MSDPLPFPHASVLAALLAVTAFAYLFAALATRRLLRRMSAPGALPPHAPESLARALLIGSAAAINLLLWALVPGGLAIGVAVAVSGALAAIPPLARRRGFQAWLGWSGWLMPYAWLATLPGLVLFAINLPFALAALGPRAIRVDRRTGTIESTGGILERIRFAGGFSLGNFSFLCPRHGTGLAIQTPFTQAGLSAHEAGHTLTNAAFGGLVHWLNAVEENVPPLRRGPAAYGELLAESRHPSPGFAYLRIWSA